MEKSIAIEVKNLKKHFKGKRGIEDIKAVDGIAFQVKTGGVFGLLGTNGADKTTTLIDWFQPCKCILSFVERNLGSAS